MSRRSLTSAELKTPTEAAGYIAGTLTAVFQSIMPIRMWITLAATLALIIFVFRSESTLQIARAIAVYFALVSVLIGSAVFHRKN